VKVNAATRRKLLDVGEAIRAFRERAGESQAAVARKIGMQRENLIRIEKGRANVTVETLMRIAGALDADVVVRLRKR
jgi:transcriptional regulator with XRE-family HTH domain